MAQGSEKRFDSIMDKLFHAPKSVPHSSTASSSGTQHSGGKKRPYQSAALGVMEPNLRGDVTEGQQPSSALAAPPQEPVCRPCDRGSECHNCARRGWINVDMDTIACEACGARCLFSTPASWNRQQVEKAALVFSLKLDNGHKLLCPWIDNTCDETLARFPPTPSPVLVDNFKECCSALLQLSALPQISSSAIKYMKSPLLEEFLQQSTMLGYENESANNREIEYVSSQHETELYYQAQKLISLCGWKPRSLTYLVDCKDKSDQSVINTNIPDPSPVIADMKNNNSLILHSANNDKSFRTDENSTSPSGDQIDPNSVVLDCRLCGATVGLWAFCTVPRPVEFFRFIGYTEVNVENDSGPHDSFNKSDLDGRQVPIDTMSDSATTSKHRSSSLNMTIAGGPPPTTQNFKATISLPIIGQNLRARLSYDSDFSDCVCVDRCDIQSDKRIRFQEKTDYTDNTSIRQFIPISSERQEVSDHEIVSQASIHDYVVNDATESSQNPGKSFINVDKMTIQTEAKGLNNSAGGDTCSSQDLTESYWVSASQKTLGGQVSCLENYGVKDKVENPVNGKDTNCSLGNYLRQIPSSKAMEFDPIRQHRHFCPWIASINNWEPGWKQTLSALYHQKNHLHSSPIKSPSTCIVKADDPIGSVRKLFTSPSTKRLKLKSISSRSTEHR